MTEGLFLCIEGSDGTGKGTQHALLVGRLKSKEFDVLELDFPQYGQPSAELVELYLNNEFGNAAKLDPRLASALFAIDRLGAKDRIIEAKNIGNIILANRFSASNMAHQGGKISDRKERIKFFNWLHGLEHQTMGIPEPDMHFVLTLPADVAQKRVLKKSTRNYTTKKLDGHEADINHLRQAQQTYEDLCATFPNKFTSIDCMDGGREKTVDEIHEEVWLRVEQLVGQNG